VSTNIPHNKRQRIPRIIGGFEVSPYDTSDKISQLLLLFDALDDVPGMVVIDAEVAPQAEYAAKLWASAQGRHAMVVCEALYIYRADNLEPMVCIRGVVP
jgi:hypothetical protein